MIPHWTEQLARRAIDEKTEPYVISAGITTSGPAHLGTLCEFLFPGTIKKEIMKLSGKQCKFYFFADIYDAFDSVPVSMQQYEAQLAPYLGKPLCDVPDPTEPAADRAPAAVANRTCRAADDGAPDTHR